MPQGAALILPYQLRLLCLCFASFFALNLAAALLVGLVSPAAIRFAESRTAVAAARLLLALRVLPLAVAGLFIFGLCVPSYLWLEPAGTSERVGLLCAFLGVLGAATWLIAIARTAHSLLASAFHARRFRLDGHVTRIPGVFRSVVLLDDESPLLALFGVFRPRLLISRGVLDSLSGDELEAALLHEQAHRAHRDNAKRLLLLLAPDAFPFFRPLRNLENAWSRFAEWAADDQAAAGDSQRAVSLAGALVRVARMGSPARLPYLSTSLLACDRDLSARVDRLLKTAPAAHPALKPSHRRLRATGFLLAGCVTASLLAPFVLSSVHELLELLLR